MDSEIDILTDILEIMDTEGKARFLNVMEELNLDGEMLNEVYKVLNPPMIQAYMNPLYPIYLGEI